MSGTASKSKAIHYKRVSVGTETDTLQDLLWRAIQPGGPAERASARSEQPNPDGDSFRLINHHKEYGDMLFGQLVYFEEGAAQPFLSMDDKATHYDIGALTSKELPKGKGEKGGKANPEVLERRKEFLNSILYFGVWENHMVVIQSAALKFRELETHLGWLLVNQVELTDGPIILHDKPSTRVIETLERKPAKLVKIGAPVILKGESAQSESASPAAITTDEVSVKKLRYTPSSTGAKVLRDLLPGIFEKNDLKDALDDANLKVSLEVTYSRKTSKSGQAVLDSISTSLRHLDDSDVRIELKDGGTINGQDLKLSGRVSVSTLPSGLIDENSLFQQMHAWLKNQIQSEKIED
ncbi:hypothetical protein [Microbulbifer agarilyticus]